MYHTSANDTTCVGALRRYTQYRQIMIKSIKKPLWAKRGQSIMKSKGITQEDLVGIFDVKTRGAVGHYFSGRREPTISQLKKFAQFIGAGIDELVAENVTSAENKRNSNDAASMTQTRANDIDLRMIEDAIIHQLDYLYKADLLRSDPHKVAKSCVAKFVEYRSRKTAADALKNLLKAEDVRDTREDGEGHDG